MIGTYHKQLLAVASTLLFVSACADPPSVTETSGTRTSELETVAFCYSGQATTRDQLFAMALEQCPDGTRRAEVWEHDTFFNNCPLTKKNRVTFQCVGY